MKRQRSYSDDLMEGDGSGNSKEWGRREQEGTKMRSLKGLDSTASTCYKKSYSSRGFNYEKDEARVSSRKRMEVEAEGFERARDGYARVSSRRDSNPRRTEVPRSSRESGGGYRDGGDSGKGRLERSRRSSSFSAGSGSKRESYENLKFGAKGFRSERERPKRDDLRSYGIEGSGSLWKRTSEDYYHRRGNGTGNETSGEDRSNGWSHGVGLAKSPQGSKETVDSFKESRKGERAISQSNSNSTSEMEEGELEPELEPEPESSGWQHHEHEQEQQTGQLKPETETEGEAEAEAEAEVEAEAEAEVEQHHEELSSKRIQEEHGNISAVEADEGMATQMDDSKHADGKVDKRDVLFGNGIRDGDREEVGNREEVKPLLDLDKTNEDGGETNDLEISPRVDTCSDSVVRHPDKAGNNVTVDEVAQELNQKEIEQQPAAGWGIEERKGVDLEVEVKMETMEDASDEIEKAEEKSNRKELTFSFMCDTPKTLGDVQDKTDAGSRGDPTLKSLNSLLPQVGEEMGKDKDQSLSLSLSNGPDVYSKWDERALLLSSERKKKAPLEEDLGVGGSNRFPREPQSSTKIEEGRSELSNEKQRQKKAKLEPLQLSLGLPDVSLTLASPSINVAPASPSRGRSYQSLSHTAHTIHTAHTQTGSDAFTTSISFSGSHPFVHNPSCSLTQNSMENYEFSVGSHPAFQASSDQVSHGNWNGTYPNEQISYDNNSLTGVASQDVLKQRREAPLYQRILQNGNLQASQFSQGMFGGNSRGQPSKDRDPTAYERGATDTNFQGNFAMTQIQHGRSSEGSLGKSNSIERHAKFLMAQGKQARSSDGNLGRFSNGPEKNAIFPRELPEQWREVKSSPTQSVGSRDKGSDQWKQIIRDGNKSDRERASMPQRGCTGRGMEHSIPGAVPSIEKVLFDIISEPIPVMCQKLKGMPAKALDHLRQCSGELIGKNEKAEEFFTLQKMLQNRTDLTSEILMQAHKVQLEILVAVKTGIKGFILNNLPPSELVEVFLQVRCRNIACKSALPVDDCECKICSQRNGFCSACMCLVCSKFDFANNTCSWIGCDVCLHWCHTDCGIRMSYVRNGPSVNGAPGTTEMQFHCIGCEHASEMFGFVKEVFRTCVEGWDVETLAKELDCVRRIFQRSEDSRGKQLWSKAGQMLGKLESKADPAEVCNSFMLFLSECDTKGSGTSCVTAKDTVQPKQTDTNSRVATAVREAVYNIPSGSGEKIGTSGTSERARVGLQNYEREAEGKRIEATEMQYNKTRNKAEIDELESIVRIKQAEAKMFQVRADDARREAEGLQRIAIAKNEKIEEEYACKLAKLCLAEVEERRKAKLEELQIIERDQREYYSMKIRMEADIKDLLMKMEAAKRRF